MSPGRFRSRFAVVVDSAERLQVLRVEALDADREPVHAGFAVAAEFLGLEGPGIRLQGDLAIGRKRQPRAKRRDQSVDRGRRKKAGRAAPEENTGDAPPPDVGKRKLEIGHERFDVGLLRNVSPRLVGIEIAVGALLHAPGNVDVESEGRQHSEPDAGGRESHYLRHLAAWMIAATLPSPPRLRRGGGRRPPGWSVIKRPPSAWRAAAAEPCRG